MSDQLLVSIVLFASSFLPFLLVNNGKLDDDNDHDDSVYLRKAHQVRCALDPPRLSNFRVVAIFVLDNGKLIVGTNDEPSPALSGALCAERCALLHYRMLYGWKSYTQETAPKVSTVYIVTDAPQPVPPGTLCREYMRGHDAVSPTATRFVLQSNDPQSTPLVTTLQELYPYPSLFSGKTPSEQVELAQSWSMSGNFCRHPSSCPGGFSPNDIQRLCQSAVDATSQDNHDGVFVIRYAAAALVQEDGAKSLVVRTAPQVKTLEYGASQDALCQLWAKLSDRLDSVRLVVQMDALGVAHAPFAPARSVWVENGGGNVPVLIRSDLYKEATGPWKTVPMKELAPLVPDFR